MRRLRTPGRRQIATTACAIVVGLAVGAPAAFAERDDHAMSRPMPSQQFINETTTLDQMESCGIYEGRFDDTVIHHKRSPQVDQARALRKAGGALCANAEYGVGIARLKQALTDIGVSTKL